MVYLAELLVVMTDPLKLSEFVLEMCTAYTNTSLNDDRLLLQESDAVVFSMRCTGRHPVETQQEVKVI